METIAYLLVAHLFALLIPGPDFALIMATSVSTSREKGLLTALGLACGLAISATTAAFILPMFLEELPQIIKLVQYAGAAYLFYLAYKAFAFAKRLQEFNKQESKIQYSAQSFWLAGFLCNITNPKALLFFLSIFSVAALRLSLFEKYFIVTAMFIVTLLYFAILAYIFSSKNLLRRLGNIHHLQARITKLSAFIFLLFASLILFKTV